MCEILIDGEEKTYSGMMVNISAGGFAFSCRDKVFAEVNNQKVTVKIKNHELLSGEKLIGAIIRSSDNDGTYIIGCRMFEDSEVIEEYVNKVMM